IGYRPGSSEKKLLHSLLSVRQAVSHKGEVTTQVRRRRDGMVRLRIEAVIDRNAIFGAEIQIPVNNWLSSSISKNKVVIGNQTSEWITRVVSHSRQRSRRINIPEGHPPPGRAQI